MLSPSRGAGLACLWGVSHSLGVVGDWYRTEPLTPPTCWPPATYLLARLPFHGHLS